MHTSLELQLRQLQAIVVFLVRLLPFGYGVRLRLLVAVEEGS